MMKPIVLALLALAVAAAAGCLDARYAGPARTVSFQTAGGRVKGRLPPLPRELTPVERETFTGLRKDRETPERILRAALLAGGVVDEEVLHRYEEKARAGFDAIKPIVEREADPKARARALLVALHDRTLRAYAVDQTYLHVILDTGVYNCLSSAVLYNIYAGWLGMPSGISILPSHARGYVDAGGHRYEVEVRAAPQTFSTRVWTEGHWAPVVRHRTADRLVSTEPVWGPPPCSGASAENPDTQT